LDHCVFIHTNHKQFLGARVAEYALRRNSLNADKFDVRIIHTRDHPWMGEYEGRKYMRDGVEWVWLNDDLQSFTPLRFMPPELMNYTGRALVMDPDIFAVGDVWELLSRDMQGKAIVCRRRSGIKGRLGKDLASSVMLLDCAKLKHWRCERDFREMFTGKRDYYPWIFLKNEPPETIGILEDEWNDFDHLSARTRLLHNTRRLTQPWKTGLPVDFRPAERFPLFPPVAWILRLRRRLFGQYGFLGRYRAHPDPNQEKLFFGLLKECLHEGFVTEEEIRREMELGHVRHDALELAGNAPVLASAPEPPMPLPAA